jgi:hypothetical protein
MSGTLGLVCGGLCCILAAVLILVAVIGLLRRKKGSPAPAPSLDVSPAPAPQAAPAPSPAPRASPPPLPPSAASLRMDDNNDGVEDFDDEDEAPTTLMVAGSGLPSSAPAPAPNLAAPTAGTPTAGTPSAPPPAPPNAGPPKATRSHALDAASMPDIPALRPGATIIPPDDWQDDYIEDEDADETMLMPRPKLDLDED